MGEMCQQFKGKKDLIPQDSWWLPQKEFLDCGRVEGGQGERGRGEGRVGAFPGLSGYLSRCESVYSQRLPLGSGWPSADWQPAEANESISPGGGGGRQPYVCGTPTGPSSPMSPPPSWTHCLICHCQVCLLRAARVKLALWKWERMFAQLTEPFEVL